MCQYFRYMQIPKIFIKSIRNSNNKYPCGFKGTCHIAIPTYKCIQALIQLYKYLYYEIIPYKLFQTSISTPWLFIQFVDETQIIFTNRLPFQKQTSVFLYRRKIKATNFNVYQKVSAFTRKKKVSAHQGSKTHFFHTLYIRNGSNVERSSKKKKEVTWKVDFLKFIKWDASPSLQLTK